LNHLVKVKLFGQIFTFQTEGDISKSQKVAALLETEIENVHDRLKKNGTTISNLLIVVLAALNIANELFEQKDHHHALVKDVNHWSTTILNKIDQTLESS